jgi:hypothetical protein
MDNRSRWLVTLSVIAVVIVAVGFLGVFAFGWHAGTGCGAMGGGYGYGARGGWGSSEPLTNEQAVIAAERYVASVGDSALELSEVMVFDNHFYAEVGEAGTGRYAFEFLIDRFSGRASPEPGPNMMWNEKYGHMAGGMMGPLRGLGTGGSMTVSTEQAVEAAQRYLERYMPGLQVEDDAAAFYGYYTLHSVRNGEVVGMLSVNGYTGDVWFHSWHGVYLGTAFEDE